MYRFVFGRRPPSCKGPAITRLAAFSVRFTTMATACLVAALPAVVHAQLDPDDYSAIAPSWTPAAGTITINTDALTISGMAGNGVAVSQPSGGPEIAAFTFGTIDIAAGVTVNVTGSRALALLAQDDTANSFVMNGIISASGGASGMPLGGTAGPGGFRGGNGGAGLGAARLGSAGAGPGGGGGASGGNAGGGGASFGGAGGDAFAPTQNNNFGGLEHGDLLDMLHGGSGGGGGGSGSVGGSSNLGPGGGGGGGAIELVSNGQLAYGGTINAFGSAGGVGSLSGYSGGAGGGSGGGVILAAQTIQQTGSIALNGGLGGAGNYNLGFSLTIGSGGGGGGGGRAVIRLPQFVVDNTNGLNLTNANLSGGAGGIISCCAPPSPLPQDRAGQPGQPGEGLVLADELLIPAGQSLMLTGTPEHTSPDNANFKIRGNRYHVDGSGATLTLDQIVQSINGIEVANGGQATVIASSLTLGVNSISGDGSASSAVHYQAASLVNGKLKGATPHTIDMHIDPTVLNSTLVNFGASVEQNGAADFYSVANGGTIHNNAATLDLVGGFNAGTMYVNSQINTSDDWFTSGSVYVVNGAAWNNSGTDATNAGNIYVGTAAVPGGLMNFNSTTLQNSGNVANYGTVNGDIVNAPGGVVSGNGTINGNVMNSGVLAPGNSPGTLSIDGDYAQIAAGELFIELASPSSHDELLVSGAATLDGTLKVTHIDGYVPWGGDSLQILQADGGIFGAFGIALLPSLPGGLGWNVVYAEFSVLLEASGVLGDYNRDGTVDAADYTVWRNMLGQTGAGLAADGNGDSMITRLDFDVWKSQYGQSVDNGVGSGHVGESVPEPASASMILLAISIVSISTTRRTNRASGCCGW